MNHLHGHSSDGGRSAPARPGYLEHPEQKTAHDDHARHAGPGGGHGKHAGHSTAMFRNRFWVSLGLTIPTLVWGHMLRGALGYTAPHFPGSVWIPPVFGTAVFVYGGWVFLQGAARELRDHLPGMMTLIALAILVAFIFSAAVVRKASAAPGISTGVWSTPDSTPTARVSCVQNSLFGGRHWMFSGKVYSGGEEAKRSSGRSVDKDRNWSCRALR